MQPAATDVELQALAYWRAFKTLFCAVAFSQGLWIAFQSVFSWVSASGSTPNIGLNFYPVVMFAASASILCRSAAGGPIGWIRQLIASVLAAVCGLMMAKLPVAAAILSSDLWGCISAACFGVIAFAGAVTILEIFALGIGPAWGAKKFLLRACVACWLMAAGFLRVWHPFEQGLPAIFVPIADFLWFGGPYAIIYAFVFSGSRMSNDYPAPGRIAFGSIVVLTILVLVFDVILDLRF